MSTFSYFFSESITDFTMGMEPNRDEQEVDSQQHSDDETEQYVDRFFLPIPLVAEIILLSLTLSLGFVLNAIIFRCYFGVKSDVARYIRVLSVFDGFAVLVSVSARATEIVFFENQIAIDMLYNGVNLGISFSMMGPLFLALDRFLIVWFPHNFQLYEKRMRRFKIVLFVVTLVLSLVLVIRFEFRIIFVAMTSVWLFLQFISCTILYAVISVKIFISERKMNEHRHVGSRCEHFLCYCVR